MTVSPGLVLGTAQLGSAYGVNNREGELSEAAAFEILDAAWEGGVRVLDTAEAYGSSQAIIGAYQKEHPDRSFRICSKLSAGFGGEGLDLEAELEDRAVSSLNELGASSFFAYYLHSFEMCRDEKLAEALQALKRNSIAESIGVSLYEPQELDYLITHAKGTVDVVQIPFNVFNCAQWIRGRLLEKASAAGISVFVRSVYLQGLVFKEPEDAFVRALGLSEALRYFRSKAKACGASRSRLACDFVRSFEDVSYVVLGCESPSQVAENAAFFAEEPALWPCRDIAGQIQESALIPQRALDPRFWPTI